MSESLIESLRKRAAIRRQIPTRKSVQEGQPDRIADLLEEAADCIENLAKAYVAERKELLSARSSTRQINVPDRARLGQAICYVLNEQDLLPGEMAEKIIDLLFSAPSAIERKEKS